MVTLAERFTAALAALPVEAGDRIVAAVSGGPDSLALADLLDAARGPLSLAVTLAHVDHGIHPDSGAVAARVTAFAAARGLACEVRRLALAAGTGETAAREHRYAALDEIRRAAGARWIATAHHADDQAETVLLRVLHGSGPAGLAAMAPVRGRVLRPLLGFTRAELSAHGRARGLAVWADPANVDPRHARSWLRGSVLPRLRERIPDLDRRLIGVAEQAAADRAAWDAVLDALPELAAAAEPDGISVAAPPLAGYDSPLGAALVRAAARRAGIVLGPRRAEQVLRLVRAGRSGRELPLGGGARAEIAFGRLRLVRAAAAAAAPSLAVAAGGAPGELRWGGWRLAWSCDAAPAVQPRNGMTAWFVTTAELRVRRWRTGDRLYPLGGRGHRLLVRCFQDAHVPRSRRADWPVLEAGGQVVWAPGVCRARELVPQQGSEALRVDVAYA